MPFPFPSFGSFLFTRRERALVQTDRGWVRRLRTSQQANLGSATDNIVTLAVGSASRQFEVYLTPARFTALEALLNTTSLFTDWDRPDPDSRQAFLRAVEALDRTPVRASACPDGIVPNTIRTRLEFVSQ